MLTNHEFVEIYLDSGQRYVITILSDFYYRDSEGVVQRVKVPVLIQDLVMEYKFKTIRAHYADPRLAIDESSIEKYAGEHWYKLSGKAQMATTTVKFQRSTYTGTSDRYDDVGRNGKSVVLIHATDFVPPINDALGFTAEDMGQFALTGNPDNLGDLDGEKMLIPHAMYGDDFED